MRRVLWEIDNRSHLLEPLTYNNVAVKTDQTYDCLTVPLTAMSDSSHDSVFVVQPDKTVKRKEVRTGPNDGTFIEILSGLKENDVVVVENFEGLKDGVKVDITLEGGGADGSGK
jgi:multidrug efflux pump subunit AcrA (membrane-fusion protein)